MNIRVLDRSVYELIAAGEVIERPSSVVKELVENSIDSGADKITLEIRSGGRSYIRVTDNGCGIAKEDIPTAFLRHATSKIQEADDLNSVETLGFRGEALASICAVSRVELSTKRREDEYGFSCVCEAGECSEPEEAGCPDGTTFIIRDLFFNVPARLKFLKKDVSEGNSCANVISKIALSHPDISFKFIRDGKTEIVTPGDERLMSSVYAVLGRDFASSLLPVDYLLSGVHVVGYVSKPLGAKANRSYQNFFVNNRYVKSVTAMVALEEAYRNMIMVGKFPACVLMIDIDPAHTDVNVHPAKLEIRFSDEKPIYDAVYFGTKNALMIYDEPASPHLTEQPKRPLTPQEIFRPIPEEPTQLSFASSKAPEPFIPPRRADTGVSEPSPAPKTPYTPSPEPASQEPEPAPAPILHDDPPALSETPPKEELKYIGEAFKTYIICSRGDELYMIDKHAAHERYNFDRLKKGVVSVDCQTLLSPFAVSLSYDGHTAAADNIDLLKRFGFTFEVLPPPDIKLTGIPILLSDDDPADLLTKVTDSLASGKIGGADEIFDDLFHSVACKASIRANSVSSPEELLHLARLVLDNEILYCPHGRPAIIKFTKYEIEKMFKRIV